MSTRKPSRACVLLLALLMLGGITAPQGLVVCVAEGDHVAIEGAIALIPCGTALHAGSSAVGAAPTDACVDTPLLQPSLRTNLERSVPTPIATTLVPWLQSSPAAPPVARLRNGADGPMSRLRASRTIVLLV